MPLKRVKPASSKRQKYQAIYAKRIRQWKKENPRCCVPGCNRPTEDCHHSRGKTGILLLVEEAWKPVCRACHDKVRASGDGGATQGVDWARRMGILCAPGQWNTCPPDLRRKWEARYGL